MTDRFPYRFNSEDTLNGEIADCIASDLVEGSGESCRVKIPTYIFYFLKKERLIMNREDFIEGLGVESSNMNKNWITNVLIESIDSNLADGNPRGHRNLIIVMEELAELSQAIAKELRDKGDNINLLELR